MLDGSDIIAVATGIYNDSANAKTGAMVQVFIMPKWISPLSAVTTGLDSSVCGSCPQRPSTGGACYVDVAKSVTAVWRAYHAGSYDDDICLSSLEGRKVRFGAWGDPAAVPFEAWESVLDICDIDNSTGYTHQARHKNFDPRIAMFCQISVETPKQALNCITPWGTKLSAWRAMARDCSRARLNVFADCSRA